MSLADPTITSAAPPLTVGVLRAVLAHLNDGVFLVDGSFVSRIYPDSDLAPGGGGLYFEVKGDRPPASVGEARAQSAYLKAGATVLVRVAGTRNTAPLNGVTVQELGGKTFVLLTSGGAK